MCGRTTQAAQVTRNIGDVVATPKGTVATIIAQDGDMSWLRSESGKNYFRLTSELQDRPIRSGDAVITAKGNPATVRSVVDGVAWVTTRRGRNVARELSSLKRA